MNSASPNWLKPPREFHPLRASTFSTAGAMRRLSRRRFVAGSGAVAAGAAAALAVGCGDGKKPSPIAPSPVPSVTPARLSATRGGILRTYNFDAQPPETLDPHTVRGGPVANMHSAVFSKLLRYSDERAGTIVPDLAEALPEQPDDLTYIFKLRKGVTFHDAPRLRESFPAIAGRGLVAADVRYSIERQIAESRSRPGRFPRRDQFGVIERVMAPNDHTVILKLSSPAAPFLSFVAGRHAFVIPEGVVDPVSGEANRDVAMIGTGPFMLESLEPRFAVKLRRNHDWFARDDDVTGAGLGRPFLNGYDAFFTPQEDSFQREAFDGGHVDSTGFLDPMALDLARTTNLADIFLEEGDAGWLLASRFLLDRPPFNDDRVRRAVHLAVDRAALLALMYPPLTGLPSARLSGPIAPSMERWALAEDDLLMRPGYIDDRAAATTQAKQLWSAALGDAPLTELHVLFAGVPRTIPEIAVAAVQRQLGDALGVAVVPQIDPSGDALTAAALRLNIEGAAEGVVAFTFGFEDGGVDLDDWVYGQFRGGAPGNTYRLQDAALDALLEKQRAEFDEEARHKLGLDIQDYLLANVNARLEYLAPVNRRLSWGYVRKPHFPIWHGSDYGLADTWLDASHPAWSRRPTG